MSTVADTPQVVAPRRPGATSRRAKPTARRGAFTGGALWIVVVGALLAGIVAVNVVVLQLNVRLDMLGRERAQLKADNARLRSQLSSASAKARIDRDAAGRLGLEAADPLTTTYVRLRVGAR